MSFYASSPRRGFNSGLPVSACAGRFRKRTFFATNCECNVVEMINAFGALHFVEPGEAPKTRTAPSAKDSLRTNKHRGQPNVFEPLPEEPL
jgi:hypothetical protein